MVDGTEPATPPVAANAANANSNSNKKKNKKKAKKISPTDSPLYQEHKVWKWGSDGVQMTKVLVLHII